MLSRERVIAAALDLADAEGIEKLSMRRLAQALGVEAMSLYNHVSNKDDLLDGLVERVVEEFHAPDPGGDWRAELRLRAQAARAALLRHPWAGLLLVSRANAGPNMLGYVEATLAVLVGAGFDYPMADRAWNAIDSHVYGFTLQELRFPFAAETYAQVAREYLPMIPDTLPHLRALTAEVAEGRHDGIQSFELGLDLLLDGLDRLRRG